VSVMHGQSGARSTVTFYTRDVVSGVFATATWLGGWLAGCMSQPVLYQNYKTYLKTFSTIW